MKIFAHRGWAEGENENTLLAFKKSVEAGLSGVEFDVRFGDDERSVILSHDQTSDTATLTLAETLQFLQGAEMELLVEFKECSDRLFELVVESLRQNNLLERTTIFAFPEVAKLFPWANRGEVKLGIIAPYPQHIKKYIEMYNPDMVLVGWGTKKERLLFKIVWAFLSLKKTFAKYPKIKFVIGVAYREGDKTWLSKQDGLYGFTADMPIL